MAIGDFVELPIHPTQKEFHEWYVDATAFRDGDVVKTKYIPPYMTEIEEGEKGVTTKAYARRVNQTANLNITETVLTQHQSSLAQDVTVTGFETRPQLLEDVTGFGDNHQQIYSDQLWEFGTTGLSLILVEAPNLAAQSEEEALALNLRPFQVHYGALSIRYWDRFQEGARKGQFRDLILENESTFDEHRKRVRHFRRYVFPDDSNTYTIQEFRLSEDEHLKSVTKERDKKFELISEMESSREEIPAVMFGDGPEFSFVRSVWPINLQLLNRLSALANINYNQAFQRSIVTGVDGDMSGLKRIGEMILGWVPTPGADVKTIEPGNPESLIMEIKMLLNWGLKIGMLKFNQVGADDSRAPQSAESKAKDMIALQNFYDDTVNLFQDKLTQVYRFMLEFADANANLEDVKVEIGRDFGLADSELDLANDNLIMSWASNFFDAESALQIQKQILRRHLADVRVVASEDEDEEEIRARLEEIIERARPRELGFRRRSGITPLGNLALTDALSTDETRPNANGA